MDIVIFEIVSEYFPTRIVYVPSTFFVTIRIVIKEVTITISTVKKRYSGFYASSYGPLLKTVYTKSKNKTSSESILEFVHLQEAKANTNPNYLNRTQSASKNMTCVFQSSRCDFAAAEKPDADSVGDTPKLVGSPPVISEIGRVTVIDPLTTSVILVELVACVELTCVPLRIGLKKTNMVRKNTRINVSTQTYGQNVNV